MTFEALQEFMEAKAGQYQRPEFLEADPIQIPHRFSRREDIEIAGFLTATIAWGNRKSIIRSAQRMLEYLEHTPFDFVMQAGPEDLARVEPFVHRTFNGLDFKTFLIALRHLYREYGGMEPLFARYAADGSLQPAISRVREHFFEVPHQARTGRHFSNPEKGSAAKRINMFLRWMVRPADAGVDFGLWTQLNPSQLSCPLDVHSGKVARALGLLRRKQNDAKALQELDAALRKLDPKDPVKYDFALFGLGAFEQFG
ncbi:TIGR02757 family protein [Robiginitalea sp. M366]|uniref:TIGR02757 family protein n=1 Tax=Robiginitalea aestuariiviva TaxID=3036903 RepID=UPI00240DE30C|nr:TIGR02757 family protein [Robiginitalea aestuariiviva]MDG1573012.1 TIGR02757 family protein [Robiginitalea aestuariiviva]